MAAEGFKRKLTAILSADVEGYSRLMDEDEEATVRTLKTYRATINDLVQQYRGRIVDSPGDNILAEFTSVVDAVNCAVEIQRDLAERNTELAYNRQMQFRIGVNLGDVIDEDGRIYGDGVNIASRVEAIAEAGGICITGSAYDQIANKLELGYEYFGKHRVKNIRTPIRVYRVLSFPGSAAHRVIKAKAILKRQWVWMSASTAVIVLILFLGLFWKYYYLPTPSDIDPEGKMAFDLPKGASIAVLPFTNMSKEPDQEYLCDGITESIISALSHLPQLFVVGRHSTFFYKGKSLNVQKVGHKLGVQFVIEGSIQKSDEQIRVIVKLIETKSGYQIWSEQYNLIMKNIFKLQDDITLEIAKAAGIHLIAGEAFNRFEGITDLNIFIKAVKAMGYFRQYNSESNILAIESAEELINLMPESSLWYSVLGASLLLGIQFGTCEPALVCYGRATEAARKALSLDENNSDAHLLASYLFTARKEFQKAISEAKRAIIINPNNSDAYDVLAWVLIMADEPLKAVEFSKKAIRLEPIPEPRYYFHLAWAYKNSDQYEKAIENYKKQLKYGNFQWAYLHLTEIYIVLGNEKAAKAAAQAALNINPNFSLEKYAKHRYYKNQAKLERHINALRKAGLPE